MNTSLVNALLMLPALLLLAIVFAWPLLDSAWLSTQASSVLTGLAPTANGGANWQRLLGDARFWQDAAGTLRFAAVSVGLELVLGLAMALVQTGEWWRVFTYQFAHADINPAEAI
jgi:multiple sugar transport system permease protein